ncbi:hypothetical protein [Marinomonas piezotolerans]|uniref:hypothetical protein n=1 Tax=Marinomonas piezotolerans TaxID=2213058 RepID=UPI0013140B4A|nr:hypothetical protein [Marinomonas piezotolerans]
MSVNEVLGLLGVIAGLSMIFVMGWLFMITITAGVAIYRKRSVREAIKPLLDEF